MQIMITHGSLANTRVLQFNRLQLGIVLAALALVLMALSGAIYHFVFVKAVRDGWPVVGPAVGLVVRDDTVQRDRFQPPPPAASGAARVSGLGGPFVPGLSMNDRVAMEALNSTLLSLDQRSDQTIDLFTLIESRLLEGRLAQLLVPSTTPVHGPVGSGFGFRTDPFSGQGALHTGLDFPADVGTPIAAAAGGMVVNVETHAGYGLLVEIDHGSGLVTRYAHASKVMVRNGDLVKRGQVVALVGNTGRSTGPHLHFEVLVDRVPQNPARFLAGRGAEPRPAAGRSRAP
jgi:murein DD-endopeptidase MepM/ murein hydrolase activator NlpD